MIAILLLLQALTGPMVPDRLHVVRPCPATDDADDVVVCGRADANQYRLKTPRRTEADPELIPRAAVRLGSAKLSADTDQATVGGVSAPRASLRLTLPF